jgi:hypothetical protein
MCNDGVKREVEASARVTRTRITTVIDGTEMWFDSGHGQWMRPIGSSKRRRHWPAPELLNFDELSALVPVVENPGPSHAELVERAVRWLYGSCSCSLVVTEAAAIGERVDAIVWNYHRSILVECKTSRSDFLADLKKPHRQDGSLPMGQQRWYFTAPGLLTAADIPQGWGLLELSTCVRKRVEAVWKPADLMMERRLLLNVAAGFHRPAVNPFKPDKSEVQSREDGRP